MHADLAETYFLQNYNCAQSVLMAFAEEHNLPLETAMKLAATLGGGLGNCGQTCGALLGCLLAIGLDKGYTTPDPDTKKSTGAEVNRIIEAFREQFGAVDCTTIKGDRAVCLGFVRAAAEMAEAAVS